jgi:XTP/dITP diphosphohydrolase
VHRIVLLVTSPRLPAGLLTAQAWDLVRAHPVWAGEESAQVTALRAAGVPVVVEPAAPAAALLSAAAEHTVVIWLAGPAGDPQLARELGLRLAREPGLAELELAYGSWDPLGARLLDAVAVVDRLVSPGGDPWKREQTHGSLAQFLLEECYEAYDAIEAGDLGTLREELGDLLLQVVLHARLAAQLPEDEAWDIDDVAGGLVDKMIRRNPHVFGDASATTVAEVMVIWEAAKRAEKARDSAMDGIALAQPALSLAAKVLSRAARAGLAIPMPEGAVPVAEPSTVDELGAVLFRMVAAAQQAGLDPEAALRRAALAYAGAVREAEAGRGPEG